MGGGGAERQDSVYRGLQVVSEATAALSCSRRVRPFVKPDEIRAVIERAASAGAALMRLRQQTRSASEIRARAATLDRRRIYYAQTPQAFVSR